MGFSGKISFWRPRYIVLNCSEILFWNGFRLFLVSYALKVMLKKIASRIEYKSMYLWYVYQLSTNNLKTNRWVWASSKRKTFDYKLRGIFFSKKPKWPAWHFFRDNGDLIQIVVIVSYHAVTWSNNWRWPLNWLKFFSFSAMCQPRHNWAKVLLCRIYLNDNFPHPPIMLH